ncbi:hypothetical protein DFO58_2154 [Arthrobacter sp. AG1021]|uniref:hypothetical protein n=1 Tax=Arthrobacter sp. AG1021 TaxID=2183908 RepID=UPI000EABB5C4|nr:hypothetical protein [Arthrobacter sp. AG1021]RKS19653.1 hypothetical protein DFO58_2154 [Arthrobacter sp. AG1021]
MSTPVHDTETTMALATYTVEKIKPLADRIPTGTVSIRMFLGDSFFTVPWSVDVVVNRRDVPHGSEAGTVAYRTSATKTEDIDGLAAELTQYVNNLSQANAA